MKNQLLKLKNKLENTVEKVKYKVSGNRKEIEDKITNPGESLSAEKVETSESDCETSCSSSEGEYMFGLEHLLEYDSSRLPIRMKDKVESFKRILRGQDGVINVEELREICFGGVPDDVSGLRSLVWKILLRYLPSERSKWAMQTNENKETYEMLLKTYITGIEEPSKEVWQEQEEDELKYFFSRTEKMKVRNPEWKNFFSDKDLWNEIEKDSTRTRAEMHFFVTSTGNTFQNPFKKDQKTAGKLEKEGQMPDSAIYEEKQKGDNSGNRNEIQEIKDGKDPLIVETDRSINNQVKPNDSIEQISQIPKEDLLSEQAEVQKKKDIKEEQPTKEEQQDLKITEKDEEPQQQPQQVQSDVSNITYPSPIIQGMACESVEWEKGGMLCERHLDVLTRMLFIYAKTNPGIKYVQGMNEIMAVFYHAFVADKAFAESVESDCFFCFTILMAEVRDCFLKALDDSESGIRARIMSLNSLLEKVRPETWKNLENLRVDPHFYSLRWLMLIFTQEFELFDVMRLWDSYLSHRDRKVFLDYLSIAVIEIRQASQFTDFSEAMQQLQHISDIDVLQIIVLADQLYEKYEKLEQRDFQIY